MTLYTNGRLLSLNKYLYKDKGCPIKGKKIKVGYLEPLDETIDHYNSIGPWDSEHYSKIRSYLILDDR